MDNTGDERPDSISANDSVPRSVPDHETTLPPSVPNLPQHFQKPSQPESHSTWTTQSITDKALDFLSHASNETLGACLVGLGATTYLVLGRVGLVIIGVAGGVVLHATWDGLRGQDQDDATKRAKQERRREAEVEVARRVLEWRKKENSDQRALEDVRVYANETLDYSEFGPESAAALNTFTDAVIKDYVHYWYDPSIPGEQSFPNSCRRTFTAFVLSLSGHLQRMRAADILVDFITNASSMIIVFLTELSAALNASPNSPPKDAVAAYLQMKPDSSLAYMLNEQSQKLKLADAAEDILQAYLDPKSYNCPPVHIFLKEVFAQLVLGSTVTMCSRPEWINDWIVYGLEESETTKEVMDIVDAGVEGRSKSPAEDKVTQASVNEQSLKSRKERISADASKAESAHRRKMSRAEEAMDEAMKEAKRLTELMIEEDRRKAEAEERRRSPPLLNEDSSDGATPGAPTPSSSQSGRERQEEETSTPAEGPETQERPASPNKQFVNFDQLVPMAQPTALLDDAPKALPQASSPSLTLQHAKIHIDDDSSPSDRTSIKAKPTTEYLIQIEPASTSFTGWMITRRFPDFETLHEVLRRISVITGVPFTETHAELPKWRGQTKASLRAELERYLNDAMRFQPLAESEGMKRFLEKDQNLSRSPNGAQKAFAWPTPDAFGKIGGDMMNVLTKAPKQVAGGGKAVFGGVAGLVGAGKRASTSQTNLSRSTTNTSLGQPKTPNEPRSSTSGEHTYITDPTTGSFLGSVSSGRGSEESLRTSSQVDQDQRRGSAITRGSVEGSVRPVPSPSRPGSVLSQPGSLLSDAERDLHPADQARKSPPMQETMNLPPPPSEMPADYDSPISPSRKSTDTFRSSKLDEQTAQAALPEERAPAMPPRPKAEPKPKEPLSDRETSIAVEVMFAVITQLYTLSGAWNIRRTFLNAAKTFLLRPGNPQITAIRDMMQTSLLDANLSDDGLAHQIYKLRENGLPTEEEMEIWRRDYPEKTEEQKEELRIKARTLLVTKGMPQALNSLMGSAASGEALGKVFDCLQVQEVSRGLIFGLMLQALRVVTQ